MTRKEFEKLSFDEVMCKMMDEQYDITTLDTLKDFAKENIDDGHYFLAAHIIEALKTYDDESWWLYDYSMGTLDTPEPIENKQDVEHLIED